MLKVPHSIRQINEGTPIHPVRSFRAFRVRVSHLRRRLSKVKHIPKNSRMPAKHRTMHTKLSIFHLEDDVPVVEPVLGLGYGHGPGRFGCWGVRRVLIWVRSATTYCRRTSCDSDEWHLYFIHRPEERFQVVGRVVVFRWFRPQVITMGVGLYRVGWDITSIKSWTCWITVRLLESQSPYKAQTKFIYVRTHIQPLIKKHQSIDFLFKDNRVENADAPKSQLGQVERQLSVKR